jgi:predicted MFS family arabinose efflux permease
VAIVKWFKGKRGLALGIANCGIPAGQMVLAPLSIYLVGVLGWRHTLLGFGLVYVVVLSTVFWACFRDAPPDLEPARGGGTEDRARSPGTAGEARLEGVGRVFQWWVPLLLVVPYFICGFTDLGLISTHLIPLAAGRGFSAPVIALTLSIDAAANLVGNVLTGYLADRARVAVVLAVMYVIRAIGLTLLFFAGDPLSLAAFAVLNGSVEASTIAPTAALCAKLYGAGRVGTVFGLVSACHQFGAASGAFVIGALFARTGGYGEGLLLSVALLVVASGLTAVIRGKGRPDDTSR